MLKQSFKPWPLAFVNSCGKRVLLRELQVNFENPMRLYCDNKVAINITHNPVQHDKTKHVEIDIHFIEEKIDSGLIFFIGN